MRDTPEHLPLPVNSSATRKGRGEVMLEIEILEVDRTSARSWNYPPASEQLIGLNTNDLNKLKASTNLTNLLTNIHSFRARSQHTGRVPIGGGLSTFCFTLPAALSISPILLAGSSGARCCCARKWKARQLFRRRSLSITLSLLSGSGTAL